MHVGTQGLHSAGDTFTGWTDRNVGIVTWWIATEVILDAAHGGRYKVMRCDLADMKVVVGRQQSGLKALMISHSHYD